MTFKSQTSYKKKPKGDHVVIYNMIVLVEDNDVYSTDSPFWRDFFKAPEKEEHDMRKIDMSIVTHNGKVIHRFKN